MASLFVLPRTDGELVRMAYFCTVSASLLWQLRDHVAYVGRFGAVRDEYALVRFAYFGCVRPPMLSPRATAAAGATLAACLLVGASPAAPPAVLAAAFALYFVFFAQFQLAVRGGGHKSLLLPSFIVLCAVAGGAAWCGAALRAALIIPYVGSALCKLRSSLTAGRWWGDGNALQVFVLLAMVARPACARLRRAVAARRWLCAALNGGGFALELVAPLALCGPPLVGAALAVSLLGLHAGVAALQGIDFLPYWGPALLVFAPDALALAGVARAWQPAAAPLAAAAADLRAGALPALVAAAWLAMLLAAAATGVEVPPFISLPMFSRCARLPDFRAASAALIFMSPDGADGVDCVHLGDHFAHATGGSGGAFAAALCQKVLVGFVGPAPRGHEGVHGVVASNVALAPRLLGEFDAALGLLAATREGEQWDAARIHAIADHLAAAHELLCASPSDRAATSAAVRKLPPFTDAHGARIPRACVLNALRSMPARGKPWYYIPEFK